MKKLLAIGFALVSLNALGADTVVYICQTKVGDTTTQILVVQKDEQGNYRSFAYKNIDGKFYDSRNQSVVSITDDADTSITFENKDAGFSATILPSFGVSESGRKLGTLMKGQFVDRINNPHGVEPLTTIQLETASCE